MGDEFWDLIKKKAKEHGLDLDQVCEEVGGLGVGIRCVVVKPDLRSSVEEMAKKPRDQVVMVRLDEKSSESLDAWVESGAVKSRSEAAALFIREGLKVRAGELDQLQESLRDLERAKSKVRDKVKEVFGESTTESS